MAMCFCQSCPCNCTADTRLARTICDDCDQDRHCNDGWHAPPDAVLDVERLAQAIHEYRDGDGDQCFTGGLKARPEPHPWHSCEADAEQIAAIYLCQDGSR